MTEPAAEETTVLPKWVKAPFREFFESTERRVQVLHLSIQGISMLRGRHDALLVLIATRDETDGAEKDDAERLALAEKEKALAQREVDHDFPVLHGQATIALWSSLESLVRSFLASWLENVPAAWQCDAVKKLRVKLGEYEALEYSARCLWIVDLVDQEVNGPLRAGVTRFETLLEPFGLSGMVDADCKKTIFELSQVRHALVHRSGLADKKLVDACPWLDLKVGQQILVSHDMWHSYNAALGSYILELIQRLRVHFGAERYVPSETKPGGNAS